jgi:CheY-like chemotaxis protein
LTESFDKIRILVAEDNKINQKVLNRTLNRIGLEEIDIVDDGQKAVEAAASKAYDIIFMDLQMPVMDGLEATRIITRRRNENGQEFPKIVFLTAHALQDYQAQAADAGGDGFISKPFKIDIIRNLIRGFQFGLASPTTKASGNDP